MLALESEGKVGFFQTGKRSEEYVSDSTQVCGPVESKEVSGDIGYESECGISTQAHLEVALCENNGPEWKHGKNDEAGSCSKKRGCKKGKKA